MHDKPSFLLYDIGRGRRTSFFFFFFLLVYCSFVRGRETLEEVASALVCVRVGVWYSCSTVQVCQISLSRRLNMILVAWFFTFFFLLPFRCRFFCCRSIKLMVRTRLHLSSRVVDKAPLA